MSRHVRGSGQGTAKLVADQDSGNDVWYRYAATSAISGTWAEHGRETAKHVLPKERA